jgi:N-formylmaleamate deformylase
MDAPLAIKDGFILNWSKSSEKINGIEIHYYRTGGGKPQVVLNHGAGDDGTCWTRVAIELQSDYDVIMVDARGHGLSSSGDGAYNAGSRAQDLAGLILALNLDQPVVGGHSMGADTAIHLAVNFPELVSGLFLEDPPIALPGIPVFGGEMGEKYAHPGRMMANIFRVFKVLPLFIGKPLARRMMTTSPRDEIIPWLNSKKRLSNDFLKSLKESSLSDHSTPIDMIKSIKIPVLLIIGDREKGAIVSTDVADDLSGAMPDLRVVHLAGASHDIRRERFGGYIQAVREFLGEIYPN